MSCGAWLELDYNKYCFIHTRHTDITGTGERILNNTNTSHNSRTPLWTTNINIFLLLFVLGQEAEVSVGDGEAEVCVVLVEGHHLLLWERVHSAEQSPADCAGRLSRLLGTSMFLKVNLTHTVFKISYTKEGRKCFV